MTSRAFAYDRFALGVSALSMLIAIPFAPATAKACSQIGPGIVSRTVWPTPQQLLPINVRIVVSYAEFGYDSSLLGEDIVLRDSEGRAVPTSF